MAVIVLGTLYQCILTESLQLFYEVGTTFQVDEIQVFDQTAGSRVGLKELELLAIMGS